jgi:fructose-bisphosphate aldolase class I
MSEIMKKNTKLYETVSALMAPGKGILAADESDATMKKRLDLVRLPNEPEHQQDFRELLFTAGGIEEYLSGVIMSDSALKSATDAGVPFTDVLTAKGMLPGIKVDLGAVELHGFKGEVVTQGLDNLAERCKEYYDLGARFAKWRAVIAIDEEKIPTEAALEMNALLMTRYAQIAQASGLVPIVEPEVIHAGDHDLRLAERVTLRALQVVFKHLIAYRVDLEGLILKSSMVLAGDLHHEQTPPAAVANATLRAFHISVPYETGGIVFLSGGQTPKRAVENLNAVAKLGEQPWPITFSYSRAIEEPVLATWQGRKENVADAQKMLLHVVKMNSLAQQGRYDASKDKLI